MRIWEAVVGTAGDLIENVRGGPDPYQAPKCFLLSLHRSGTRSATNVLEELGLRTAHWPVRHNGFRLQPKITGHETELDHVLGVIEPVINRYDALADVPVPVLYRNLDARYPNAKFILLRRSTPEWIRSVRKHIGKRPFNPYERVQYWHYFSQKPQSLQELSDSDLSGMNERHASQVMDYFSKHGSGKFVFHVLEDPLVGAKIGTFLGRGENARMPHIKDPRIVRWRAPAAD